MKNILYLTLKALFILEIFIFLFWVLGYVEKRLDKNTMVSFKIHDVTDATNSSKKHFAQYLKIHSQPDNEDFLKNFQLSEMVSDPRVGL